MKIADLDPNLKVESSIGLSNLVWLDVKKSPFRIHGLMPSKPGVAFTRMPDEIAATVSAGVRYLATNTAGGRIRFRTNSTRIALKAVMPDHGIMAHITMVGQAGFDLYASDKGEYRYAGSFIPGARNHGFETWRPTDGGLHTYTVNMPLYDPVEEVYIGLDADALLEEAESYSIEKPVVYYGSSITQGGCASRPGNAYQAMISRALDCDFINLGFSGNAHGEPQMAAYLASLDASVFVCDYDHNEQDAQTLAARHFPLYETYRTAHPEVPIVFVTRPDFHPDDPVDVGRREVVIGTYRRALASGDKNVLFVDGAHLFDGDFADSCTVDGCHPNDLGFYRMARGIGAAVKTALGF